MMAAMTRRGSMGLISAGALSFPFLSLSKERGDALRFGVIGYGRMGEIWCDHLLDLGNRVSVSSICDIWDYRRKQGAFRVAHKSGVPPNVYADHSEMLENEKGRLDAVVIVTPDCFHEAQARDCLRAGLHVFCESPMAVSSESARRMVSDANGSGRIFQCATLPGVNPWMRYCKEHFVGGGRLLGEILMADSGICRSPPQREKPPAKADDIPDDVLLRYGYRSMDEFCNWRLSEKLGGRWELLWFMQQADFFTHMLSALPSRLTATSAEMSREMQARTLCVSLAYRNPKGETLCTSRFSPVYAGHGQPWRETYMLGGQHGTVVAYPGETYIQQTEAFPVRDSSTTDGIQERWEAAYNQGVLGKAEEQRQEMGGDIVPPFTRGHSRRFHFTASCGFDEHAYGVRSFVKSILDGTPVCGTAQDGLTSILLADAVQESVNTGKTICLDETGDRDRKLLGLLGRI